MQYAIADVNKEAHIIQVSSPISIQGNGKLVESLNTWSKDGWRVVTQIPTSHPNAAYALLLENAKSAI